MDIAIEPKSLAPKGLLYALAVLGILSMCVCSAFADDEKSSESSASANDLLEEAIGKFGEAMNAKLSEKKQALEDAREKAAETESKLKAKLDDARREVDEARTKVCDMKAKVSESADELAEKAKDFFDAESYYDTLKSFYEAKIAGYELDDDDMEQVKTAYRNQMKRLDKFTECYKKMMEMGRKPSMSLDEIEKARKAIVDWYSELKSN